MGKNIIIFQLCFPGDPDRILATTVIATTIVMDIGKRRDISAITPQGMRKYT
jgi:hypothetical protein